MLIFYEQLYRALSVNDSSCFYYIALYSRFHATLNRGKKSLTEIMSTDNQYLFSHEYDDVDERCLYGRVFKCCHYNISNLNVLNDHSYNRYVTVVGTKGRL